MVFSLSFLVEKSVVFFRPGGGVKACVKALASGATLSGEEVGRLGCADGDEQFSLLK